MVSNLCKLVSHSPRLHEILQYSARLTSRSRQQFRKIQEAYARCLFATNVGSQPGSGERPLTVHGPGSNPQHIGDFWNNQSTVISFCSADSPESLAVAGLPILLGLATPKTS